MPKYSAAKAWAMAMSILSRGMGRVSLINSTEVRVPDSTSIYPVGMASMPYSRIKGAALTCSPIKSSGLRPLTSDRKRIASAVGTT